MGSGTARRGSLMSGMANSVRAWARWKASAPTVDSLVLAAKAWYRQSGHSCAWVGSVRRVRRTTTRTRRRFPFLEAVNAVSATCASPLSV